MDKTLEVKHHLKMSQYWQPLKILWIDIRMHFTNCYDNILQKNKCTHIAHSQLKKKMSTSIYHKCNSNIKFCTLWHCTIRIHYNKLHSPLEASAMMEKNSHQTEEVKWNLLLIGQRDSFKLWSSDLNNIVTKQVKWISSYLIFMFMMYQNFSYIHLFLLSDKGMNVLLVLAHYF